MADKARNEPPIRSAVEAAKGPASLIREKMFKQVRKRKNFRRNVSTQRRGI